MPLMEQKKPRCKLLGTDGNVFALASRVISTLKKAGQEEKAQEFWQELKTCRGYDKALQLVMKYVEVY